MKEHVDNVINIIKNYLTGKGYDKDKIDDKLVICVLNTMPVIQDNFIDREWMIAVYERIVSVGDFFIKYRYKKNVAENSEEIIWHTLHEVVPYTEAIKVTKYKPKE